MGPANLLRVMALWFCLSIITFTNKKEIKIYQKLKIMLNINQCLKAAGDEFL